MNKEEQAREKGWVPQEEWVEAGREESDWVAAGEYLYRGQLMDRISSQSSQLRDLKGSITALEKQKNDLAESVKVFAEHNRKMGEVAYKKALTDLRKMQSEATLEGDHDTAADIEEKIDDLKKQAEAEPVQDTKPQEPEDTQQEPTEEDRHTLENWIDENPWFKSDPALYGATVAVANTLEREGMALKDFLAKVKEEMVKKFPEKLAKKRSTTTVTEPGADGTAEYKPKSKYTVADLSPEQRKVVETFVASGADISPQEYVDQLAELDELG